MLHFSNMRCFSPPNSNAPGSKTRSYLLGLTLLVSALMPAGLMMGCGETAAKAEVNRQELEALLRNYLPLLGQAYAERDSSVLEDLAVPKEMARIDLRIEELTAAGRIYEPEFKEVTVEDISVWNYSNAFVTTLEVWDVRSFTVGSHLLLNESLAQRNRVKYQVKRKDDSWVILYRELDQSFDQ